MWNLATFVIILNPWGGGLPPGTDLLTGLMGTPAEAGPLAHRCLTVPLLEQLGVGECGDVFASSSLLLSSDDVVDPELTPLELCRTRLGGPA